MAVAEKRATTFGDLNDCYIFISSAPKIKHML